MNPQPPKALLGAARPGPVKKTKLGIAYQDNGFSSDKPKKLKKTVAWLEKRGHRPDLIMAFERFAIQLEDEHFIPREIDRAFTLIRDLWLTCTCGGKHKKIAEAVDPKSIRIIIEAAPFWVESIQDYAKGGAMDNNTIRAAIIAFYDKKPPAQADLRDFRHTVAYEIGNLIARRGGHVPRVVSDEVGHRNPCGIF